MSMNVISNNAQLIMNKKPPAILTLTNSAIVKIKELLKIGEEKNNKRSLGLRIGVKQGGCNGNTYTFDYIYNKVTDCVEIVDSGVTVFVDKKAIMFIIGTELDYKDEKTRKGFVFVNPNAKGSCGCGKSFNT